MSEPDWSQAPEWAKALRAEIIAMECELDIALDRLKVTVAKYKKISERVRKSVREEET